MRKVKYIIGVSGYDLTHDKIYDVIKHTKYHHPMIDDIITILNDRNVPANYSITFFLDATTEYRNDIIDEILQ